MYIGKKTRHQVKAKAVSAVNLPKQSGTVPTKQRSQPRQCFAAFKNELTYFQNAIILLQSPCNLPSRLLGEARMSAGWLAAD